MKITSYTLHRLNIPLPLPIGDSQVRFDEHWLTVLELHCDNGTTGVGFGLQQGKPTCSLADLKMQFEYSCWNALKDQPPLHLAQRITRPRGGNVGGGYLILPVETALWDLVGKQLEMPLYRVFGGEHREVRAYGSTLDFRLSDEDFRKKLQRVSDCGFRAVKTKVGHTDIQWDLRRLAMVYDVMGKDIDLMVDANEAWSVKETLIRMNRYRDAGFEIFWIEDPITRGDYEGYARLCTELTFTRVNTGEYVGFSEKRQLLERGAVDVLNLHDAIHVTRAAAHLAADYGIPTSMGNTFLEIGVHLGASLPECLYMEFSDLAWNEIAQEPVEFRDGFALAPDRPGHGMELNQDKLTFYSKP
ncbi:MAG: mandelate racemase/muconate lactonizing enzyme family protein [Pirellulaceae bacterium]|nr:mandelate racemase/muconate lactonizing enzyme family protein [Pirellulaceae bacterium]